MRPRQWTKNIFLMAALIFDRQLTNLVSLKTSLLGFFLFCGISGSVYLINDIFDVKSDQEHPIKKNRPIASGKLPVEIAIFSAILITICTLWGAYVLSSSFFLIILTYFITNLFYSRWLKHIPILDVLIIAFGFVLRVAAGVSLIQVERFSPWLYVVMTLLALYLGFGKRRSELAFLADCAEKHRKVLNGYSVAFLDQLITIVSSTTIVAYSLYTFSAPNLPDNHSMMLTIPFVLYAIFRYLYLIQIKNAGGEPEELLLTDHPLQISILLYGISVLIIFYIF
jgi:4-hydroxybenzoate polyprenyltransferase